MILTRTSNKKIEIRLFGLNARLVKQPIQRASSNYSVPMRVSVSTALRVAKDFLQTGKSKTRLLLVCSALFGMIGIQLGTYAKVERGNIPNRRRFRPNILDLECVDKTGKVVLAVEVKDRALTLADVEGTITKTRNREIQEVFFTTPKVSAADADKIKTRLDTAFAAGQSFYVFDFFSLARAVLALGGNAMRRLFLQRVGEHLDTWITQPSHRQAWQRALQSL
jgi:hypothetical protein